MILLLKRYALISMLILLLLAPSVVWASANPLINLNVVDEDVSTVIHTLAMLGGVNVVLDSSVSGKVTIQFNNVPFDTALDILAKTKGLSCNLSGDVLIVGQADKMNNNFGTVNIFKIKYAKASDAVQMLSVLFKDKSTSSNSEEATPAKAADQSKSPQINISVSQPGQKSENTGRSSADKASVPGRFKVDEATNSIIFVGSPSEVEQINKILAEIDIPYQQVSLEAQVVAANKNDLKDLGLDWTFSSAPTYPTWEKEKVTMKTPVYNTDGTIKTNSNGDAVTTETEFWDWKITRPTMSNGSVGGIISFGQTPEGHPYEFYYQAKVSALVTNGKAQILAKPKVTTINGKEAHILIGDSVPLKKTTTSNNVTETSVEYKDVGILLQYTPRINADGYITATVHTEVSTPTMVALDSTTNAYRITKREAETEVRMKDGETMVIGGLIGSQETKEFNKVPFFSDLPILGSLFKSVHNSKEDSEVVIFLTAHIVK